MQHLKDFIAFLKKDTWQSWLVSLILIVLIIKFLIFPGLSLATGSELPLVVIESCSMYHSSDFDSWWNSNSGFYEQKGISKQNFQNFSFKNGLNKGDIILVKSTDHPLPGDIIIFSPKEDSTARFPIIHRVVDLTPLQTKGDNNDNQLHTDNNVQRVDETSIDQEQVIGKSIARIPALGWVKLIFFDPLKPVDERGLCK